MKYMGSKARIAKHLLPLILADRKDGQWYVEPFAGGFNMIDKVSGNRIGADCNKYLIAMFSALVSGWMPPVVSKEDYNAIKGSPESYPDELVGWVGFNCSYSGKFFGGYAGITQTKGGIRNYQSEALKNTLNQVKYLKGCEFRIANYNELIIPDNSIIYCDIPYKGTTQYKHPFDHNTFYDWCKTKKAEGNSVFVSEYEMPSDFTCIWEGSLTSSLSANGKIGGNKVSIERLYELAEV